MIVRLSEGQWRTCEGYATPRHLEYLERFVQVSRNFKEINIPCAGAMTLITQFEQGVFTRIRGKRRAGTPASTMRALSAVARAVNVWTTHPAFANAGKLGVAAEVLAAWPYDGRYSPIPVAGAPFMLLVPQVERVLLGAERWVRTLWRPGNVTFCDTEIINEEEHHGWT